jgi:hypothetical protein
MMVGSPKPTSPPVPKGLGRVALGFNPGLYPNFFTPKALYSRAQGLRGFASYPGFDDHTGPNPERVLHALLYNPFRVKRRSADVTQGGAHDYVVR